MGALLATAGLVTGGALGCALVLSLLLRSVWRRAFYRPWGFADPRASDVEGIELIDLKDAPGAHLFLWHLPPRAPGAPVLLFFDGVRGNLGLWNRRWRRIAAAGAGFVAVSYRGYGGSTGRPTEPGLLEDCRAGLAWAEARYGDRVVLHGYSMGCAFAARLAAGTERPVILEGAGLSVRHAIGRVAPFLLNRVAVRDGLEVARWLGRAEGPVLIAHGRRDRIIPLAFARRLYERARAPKRFEVFDNGNHVNLSVVGLYPRVWAWLGYAPGGAFAEAMFTEEAAGPDDPFAPASPAPLPGPLLTPLSDPLPHPSPILRYADERPRRVLRAAGGA